MIGPVSTFTAPKKEDPLAKAIRLRGELLASQEREADAQRRMRKAGPAVRAVLVEEVKVESARQKVILAEIEAWAERCNACCKPPPLPTKRRAP